MTGDQGRAKPNTRSGSSTADSECATEMREIKRQLEEINKKLFLLTDLKQTVEKLEASVSFISSQYDSIVNISEQYKKQINELDKEVLNSKNINIKNEIEIRKLTDKINFIEQYSRNINIEVHGINEVQNEDCKELVLNLAKTLEIQVTESDVDVAHRLSSVNKKQPRPIIAQFSSRTKRDLMLHKKKLVITDSSVPGTSIGTTIYINENISPYYKNLYKLTRNQAKISNFQFVWFKDSKLLIRKNSNSRVHRINSEDDINKYMCEC